MEQVSAKATSIIGIILYYIFLANEKPAPAKLDFGYNTIVLSTEYYKKNNIKTQKTFCVLF